MISAPRSARACQRFAKGAYGRFGQHCLSTHVQAQVSGFEFSTSTLSTLLRAARRLTFGVRRTSAVVQPQSARSVSETRVAKTQIRTMSGITIDTINPAVKDMHAVRGAIVSKAGEIAAALKEDLSGVPVR